MRKNMGGGIFEPQEFCLVIKFLVWIFWGRSMNFETLQNWLPGLTRHRLKFARHHRILRGRGSVVSAVSSILFWKLSYFKCTNKKNVNNVCFNSRKVTFKTAEITLILSFIKKALWNNARAGQDYPRAANYWKFYRVKIGRKHVHNFLRHLLIS